MRSRLTILLTCALGLAFQAVATPLQVGRVYLIRGNSNRYLSASPTQTLTFSANTAGWEQWSYTGTGFVSYHGTSLIVEGSGSVFHAAKLFEERLSITGVADRDSNMGTIGVDSATADEGGRVTITMFNGRVNVIMQDTGGAGPGATSQTSTPLSGVNVPISFPTQQFTIIPVPSPDATRKAALVGLDSKQGFAIVSFHNTYLATGGFTRSESRYDIVQSAASNHVSFHLQTSRLDVRFGTWVSIQVGSGSMGQFYLGPGVGTAGQFKLQNAAGKPESSDTAWNIVDPSGRFKDGDRVPLNYPVLLKNLSLAKNLSADGDKTSIVFSANSAAWEQWTIQQ